jgi:hypothetical protein
MTIPSSPEVEYRGSQIPDAQAITSPAASCPVELDDVAPVIPVGLPPAMEMPVPWKSQNDFHRTLEISHGTRDSHTPTSHSSS